MIEELIPIALFAAIAAVVCTMIVFKSKGKREQQETIRFAIEKGQELTPDLIAQIGQPARKSRDKDLRTALLSFAIGGGFIALGMAIPDDDATVAMLGVASFPIFIGLAFLIMYFFGSKDG